MDFTVHTPDVSCTLCAASLGLYYKNYKRDQCYKVANKSQYLNITLTIKIDVNCQHYMQHNISSNFIPQTSIGQN